MNRIFAFRETIRSIRGMTTGEATGKPPAYREFSLVFEPPDEKRRVNFMRDVRKDEWNISKLADPIYFYQPYVEPTPEGGRVLGAQETRRGKNKYAFVKADRKGGDVDQEEWVMLSSDGKEFSATPDTLRDRAVMYQRDENTFVLSFLSQSLRVVEKFRRDSADPEALARRRNLDLQEARKRMGIASFQEEVIAEKMERKRQEKERVEMNLDANSDHSDGGGGRDGEDELDIEWEDLFDDDQLASDPEPVSEPSMSSDVPLEEEEDHNEEEDAQKKVHPVNRDGTPVTPKDIVDRIFEDYVTEEELVSYMSEVGLCKKGDLNHKFGSRLKSQKQKERFVELVHKKLIFKEVDGQKWFALRRVKKH